MVLTNESVAVVESSVADLQSLASENILKTMRLLKLARIRHIFYPNMPQDYSYELSAFQA